MRSLERHRDVAAYALGVLNEAEAFRFEDHLMECPRCAAHVTEFGPITRQLMLYRRATPRFVHPMTKPGPQLLNRLLETVAARQRARRRRTMYAVAASVVIALAGPGVAMMASGNDQAAQVVQATDARSGVWAQVTTENEAYGSQVELKVKDGSGARPCHLIAIGRDGSEETVTSWHASDHGSRENTMTGTSAMHSDEIVRYEVRTAGGEHLVTLEPR
ncbi:membrane protein [Streptomyces viridochromogenes]|uniref:Membrane protein n=1 Tax=Streptomyces viridochromogenes TaxID=1938 RepID=A0A0J7ZLN9_STRVR|nr:zf-HC2 domain-containing protein [Streptomyces viridochromogenes]KMS76347.1 membrane protein [Streptomyces viridochromogenes]KOG20460.1 membrane protein [Streptomyces viridochromogenes]KOG22303.1 membrane protein [Streptomyces viridochromogenes]